MNRQFCKKVAFLLVLSILVVACGGAPEATTAPTQEIAGAPTSGVVNTQPATAPKVAVLLKDLALPHWVDTKLGAETAGKDLGMQVDVYAQATQADIGKQLDMLDNILAQNYNCIYVTPITKEILIPGLVRATKAGVYIVNVDEAVDFDIAKQAGAVINSYIGTDNVQAGTMAADWIAEKLGGKGKVALLEGVPGSSASIQRSQGFTEGIAKYPDIKLVLDQTAHWAKIEAMDIMRPALQMYPDLGATFSAGGEMGLGAKAVALELNSPMLSIAVDSPDYVLEAVRDGQMDATIAQYPYLMGYMGVEACVKLIHGETVPEHIISPLALITPDIAQLTEDKMPLPFFDWTDPLK